MNKDPLPTLSIAVGAIVSIGLSGGEMTPWHSILGAIMLVILGDQKKNIGSSKLSELAYFMISAFCIIILFGYLIDISSQHYIKPSVFAAHRDQAYFIAWSILTLLLCGWRKFHS